MEHYILPVTEAAVTPQASGRIIPENLTRECQNAGKTDLSTDNNALHALHAVYHTSTNIATINRELANEGAALVLMMIAEAGRRS